MFMVLTYLKKLFFYYKDYRRAFAKYSALSVVAAFLELCGVALTYPFILKLLSGDSANISKIPTFVIGLIIIVLFLLKNLFMVFYTYLQLKFINNFEIMIKKRIMNFFLVSDYAKTSKLSLAQKNKIFNYLIPNTINNFILRLLNFNVNVLIFAFIVFCIAVKFPIATFVTTISGIILVTIQNTIYKPIISKMSEKVSKMALLNGQKYNESVLNIKNIKIANREKYFYDGYCSSLKKYYEYSRRVGFLSSIPPYVIEPFAIILLFILLLIISCQNYASPEKLVASFALVATAIFRITPAISRIQVNLNGINSVMPIVKEFIEIYDTYKIQDIQEVHNKSYAEFKDSIEIRNLYFAYEDNKYVLNNINLKIIKGEFIGIAGLSGVGKTTLTDIISGLYKPSKGEILIDGKKNDLPLKVGYIPQEFSLIDGTIRDNVAFGAETIDDEKIIDALKNAQIYDFIQQNYESGIYSQPFTDSCGMSQGQKQRIAIARALYTNPDILILDEATSSLDLKTEDEICNVLKNLKGDKTIIVIAHRLSTIKAADRIIFMQEGSIKASAPFNELVQISEEFRNLVKLS